MPVFPDDIFTEPDDVDPDTLANLGPLRRLAGVWEGRKGVDLNPKADGPGAARIYRADRHVEPIDPQANGPQLLLRPALPHPHQHRGRGHHLPRPGRLLAVGAGDRAGACRPSPSRAARWRSPAARRRRTTTGWSVTRRARRRPNTASARRRSSNMRSAPTATASRSTFNADGSWSYVSDTMLEVRGQAEPFATATATRLVKVGEPVANPWANFAGRSRG